MMVMTIYCHCGEVRRSGSLNHLSQALTSLEESAGISKYVSKRRIWLMIWLIVRVISILAKSPRPFKQGSRNLVLTLEFQIALFFWP